MVKFQRNMLLLFGLSLLLTLGTLSRSSKDYVDAATFGIPPSGDSDFRETISWGRPLGFLVDHPYKSGVGRINRSDIFQTGFFIYDWIVWFGATGIALSAIEGGMWGLKKIATFTSPQSNPTKNAR